VAEPLGLGFLISDVGWTQEMNRIFIRFNRSEQYFLHYEILRASIPRLFQALAIQPDRLKPRTVAGGAGTPNIIPSSPQLHLCQFHA
jgi:hypothetical protein